MAGLAPGHFVCPESLPFARLSSPRKRGPITTVSGIWIPACAGMTPSYWRDSAPILEPQSAVRLAISSRRRRADDDRLAGIDDGRVGTLQRLQLAVLAPHRVLADLACLPAGETERAHAAVARQDGAIHLLQETDGAANAVPRVPFAPSARTFADVEVLEQHGIAELQHFRVGEPGVGHVGVHGVGAGEARARRRARADGLVVLVLGVAE